MAVRKPNVVCGVRSVYILTFVAVVLTHFIQTLGMNRSCLLRFFFIFVICSPGFAYVDCLYINLLTWLHIYGLACTT